VAWGQFLLIPGMAAAYSRAIYGSHQWRRRTLTILLAGALGVPTSLALFLFMVVLLAWASERNMILFALLLSLVLGTLAFVAYWSAKNRGKWAVQADAARWLADRRSELSQRDRAWRRRDICGALWVPALIALSFFLFLPETWGVLSHFGTQNSGDLSGYRASVPATWIVLSKDEQPDGRSWITGLAGRGIGLGGNPLRFDSLSSWQISTGSFDQSQADYDGSLPKENEILGRRALTIGHESLECVDYWPSYDWGPARSAAVAIAHVQCSSANRLRASFDGRRDQLPDFYQMLTGITNVR
jgi:hypothetical protein